MNRGEISPTVLMCHAPIVVPGITSPERAASCAASTSAMRAAADRIRDAKPDALVVVSPHAPRHAQAFLVATDLRADGDFGRFGVPEVGASLPGSPERARAIVEQARLLGVLAEARELGPLDHGALVPLFFVAAAGFRGPTVWMALPMHTEHESSEAMGRAIRQAALLSGERWAFIASGDMSHRLTPDAPAGFSTRAAEFDLEVVSAVGRGDVVEVRRISPALRELAAEDVVDSLDVALGVTAHANRAHETLSYEGPYGVGYLIAILDAS
jgi:aromatic ring-opening dioxygenase LigB subunit